MIYNDERRQGDSRMQFSPAATEGSRRHARVRSSRKPMAVAASAVPPNQLNLTGSQLIVAATYALCLASLSVWLVRYWLFAR